MRQAFLRLTSAMAAVVGACSAYEEAGSVATPDAGSSDAASSGSEAATTSDANPSSNAVLFDDFESGSTCAGWAPFSGATALPGAPGHAGARSCVVCATGAGQGISKGVSVDGGGTYSAVLWVRRQMDAGTGNLELSVQAHFGPSPTDSAKNATSLTDQWQVAQTVLATRADTTGIAMQIVMSDAACVLIDDFTLTRD